MTVRQHQCQPNFAVQFFSVDIPMQKSTKPTKDNDWKDIYRELRAAMTGILPYPTLQWFAWQIQKGGNERKKPPIWMLPTWLATGS